jgi:hypothetical protein
MKENYQVFFTLQHERRTTCGPAHVCLFIAFLLGGGQSARPEVIVEQQCEPVVVNHVVIVISIAVSSIVILIVIVIPWSCLRQVGHPFASAISGYIIQTSREPGLLQRGFATHGARPLLGTTPSGKAPG